MDPEYAYGTQYQHIMGIDPGTTIGLFIVNLSMVTHKDELEVVCNFNHLQTDKYNAYVYIEDQITVFPGTVVGIERYTITPRTGKLSQQPAALKEIGTIENMCADRGIKIITQSRSDTLKLASDEVLRHIGWYKPGMDHANDAARHALFVLSGVRPMMFKILIDKMHDE